MNILLLAPQPFYEERGTPIAVRLLAESLCAAGHRVDLLTFHLGDDIALPGLTIHRIRPWPRFRTIAIGFSPAKLWCDLFLVAAARRLARRNRYDVVHGVEEGIFCAVLLPRRHAPRIVYDMDSSMADQLVEKWPRLAPVRRPLLAMERFAVRRADHVVAVCEALAERARGHDPDKAVTVLEDVAVEARPSGRPVDDLRAAAGADTVLVLYAGNLEPYQGIDLLLDGMALTGGVPPLKLVVIGGSEADIARYRQRAAALGIDAAFLGPRPLADLMAYLRQADILVSPRIRGVNTPMKIYSYLAAGRAVIATAIRSHTQVLAPDFCRLVAPDPQALAAALRELGADPVERETLGRRARERAVQRHSVAAFRTRLETVYRELGAT